MRREDESTCCIYCITIKINTCTVDAKYNYIFFKYRLHKIQISHLFFIDTQNIFDGEGEYHSICMDHEYN